MMRIAGANSAPRSISRRWRALGRNRMLQLGVAVVVLAAVAAVMAPWLAPADPSQTFDGERLRPPSLSHLIGTDEFTRDVFSRVIHGARVSIAVGVIVTLFCSVVGGALGLIAGYYRSADHLIMRVLDGLMAFPGILLAIALAAALGPSIGTVIATLVVVYTPAVARVVRGPTLVNREAAYVTAARALGASDARILLLHLLPGALTPLLVQTTFTFSFAVLAEATLSFLGVGVPPDIPTWGNMLSEAKVVISQAPWLTVGPGAALATLIVGLNLVGEGLRDVFDPHQLALDEARSGR